MIVEDRNFTYQKEPAESPFLGKLTGVCADIINATRNGRKYSQALWQKVFEDPIVQEQLDNGGIIGEAMHPLDREEVDVEKAAIIMKEKPEMRDGKLWATFHILNTPCGKILKTLCDAGVKMGISSRGSGDTFTNYDGNEEVDPDSYDFKCFDAVFIPAVKDARMEYITESFANKKSLKESLNNLVNSSEGKDKNLIVETLKDMDLLNDTSDKITEQSNSQDELIDNIDEVKKDDSVVNNEDNILSELQEALNKNQKLENTIVKLQEKLSACYTRESDQEDEIAKYKKVISKLTPSVSKVKGLEEKLSTVSKQLDDANTSLKQKDDRISKLSEDVKFLKNTKKSLNESVVKNVSRIRTLNEQYQKQLSDKDEKINSLQEELTDLQKDTKLKQSEYNSNLSKSNKLVEKYKKIANKAVDKYIESQAIKLGVTTNEIKNKLPSSYSFDDIDTICENLQDYKMSINKLPFRSLPENYTMKVTPSKEKLPIPASNFDDDVDDGLLSLAGLK